MDFFVIEVRFLTFLLFFLFIFSAFLFTFLFFLFLSAFIQVNFKLLNFLDFLLKHVVMVSRINALVHFVHDVGDLPISVLSEPCVLADEKTAISLESIPALSEHVLFLLLGFLFESGFIGTRQGFLGFGQSSNNCFFEFDLKMLNGKVGDEVVRVELGDFFFIEGIGDFDLKEESNPFGEGVAIFSSEPKRLVFTSFMKLST